MLGARRDLNYVGKESNVLHQKQRWNRFWGCLDWAVCDPYRDEKEPVE